MCEKISAENPEILQRRILALEAATEMAVRIIRDITYNHRDDEPEYKALVTDFIVLTETLLGE